MNLLAPNKKRVPKFFPLLKKGKIVFVSQLEKLWVQRHILLFKTDLFLRGLKNNFLIR